MSPLVWLLVGFLHLWWSTRYFGQTGSERFQQLPERRAQAVHEFFASRVHDFLLVVAGATCLLGLLFALIMRSFSGSVWWGVDVIVLLLALVLRRRARPVVLDAFRARQLAPLQARETSARRNRRQKQFGAVALSAFLVGETARFFGQRQDIAALEALAAGALLVTFVAVAALLWSTAWVYGDEVKSG